MTLELSSSGDQVAARLQASAAALADLARPDEDAADLLAAAARARAPRRSGLLQTRIRSTGGGRVVADVQHAVVVHNGHRARHITARPFARNAVEDTRDQVTDVYVDHVTRSLT